MFQLSAVIAQCCNWCLDLAERTPRWQGLVIQALAGLGFVAVAILAPSWVLIAYWVVVLGPVGVFGAAHHSVRKKRDKIRQNQQKQLQKTTKFIGRFKQ